jgi:putative ABC transport system ATP-binding protein
MGEQPAGAAGTAVAEPPAGDMVVVEDLRRTYVPRGELVALKGRSGSGKTTILNLVGGLDSPDGGTIRLDGTDLAGLGDDDLLALCRDRIGFVFQSFGLIPILTAAENVGVPMRLRKVPPKERDARVDRCPWSGSRTTRPSAPPSSPAASSSASPSPAPWPTARSC